MLEDYFFAQTADGRGSKVDTLPGGENLGQIDDLRYFNNKLLRGLRVPSSYLSSGPEDGSAVYNDGKVGIAYIQEYRFARYVERLQKQIQEDMDMEFKLFLKHRGITIDNADFFITFNKPMNFSSYRDLQLDTERANLYNTLATSPHLANQFKLKKYLGLSEEEMKDNESLWRKENDYKKFVDDTKNMDLRNIGVRAEPEAAVNLDTEIDPMNVPDIEDPVDAELGINTDTGMAGAVPPGTPEI
jgi:hypothetical protein